MKHKSVPMLLLLWVNLVSAQDVSHARVPTPAISPATVRELWMHYFNNRNADGVLSLYAENAIVATDGGIFEGRENIRRWVQVGIDQGSRVESIDAIEEKTSGKLAYGTGRSRRWVGSDLHLGRYLIVMERVGDEWKIVQHFSLTVRSEGSR